MTPCSIYPPPTIIIALIIMASDGLMISTLLVLVAASAVLANPAPEQLRQNPDLQQKWPYAKQQEYARVRYAEPRYEEERNQLSYLAYALEQVMVQENCHVLQIPTYIRGPLHIEVCNVEANGCGHVSVMLEPDINIHIEICDEGLFIIIIVIIISFSNDNYISTDNGPCLDSGKSNGLCTRVPSFAISVPLYVGTVAVTVHLSLFPSVAVCVTVHAATC